MKRSIKEIFLLAYTKLKRSTKKMTLHGSFLNMNIYFTDTGASTVTYVERVFFPSNRVRPFS